MWNLLMQSLANVLFETVFHPDLVTEAIGPGALCWAAAVLAAGLTTSPATEYKGTGLD